MKVVSKEDFTAWLQSKPQLESQVVHFCEPPVQIYYDPAKVLSDHWPSAVVGRIVLYEGYPKEGTPPFVWAPNRYEIEESL